MLSEFIQLNAFKSHPNLPRAIPLKIQNAKFSLQFPKNTPFMQPQESQQLIPKKFGIKPLKTTSKQIDKKSIHKSSNFSNFSIMPNCGYFVSRENELNNRKGWNHIGNFQTTNKKIPLIHTPNKENSLNERGSLLSKKSVSRLSSSKAFLRLNSEERVSYQKYGSVQSFPFNYCLQKKIPLIKSMQQQILCRNEHQKTIVAPIQSKKTLIKSASQQNLSPLKQKLYKITNKTNQYHLSRENHGFDREKRNLQRSDSFKRIIQQSKQKRRTINDQKQNRKNDLNVEYYVGATIKKPEPSKKQNNKIFKNTDRLIKSPPRKPKCLLKTEKSPLNVELNIQRKKVDSFVEEHVLNSNMFSLNHENSGILNMDPY